MVQPVLPPIPGRVLHVDGDYMAYWAGGIDSLSVCRDVALTKIKRLQQVSLSASVLVHLTDEASSKADRYIIAEVKPYQGQRSGKGKPQHWAAMRQFLSTTQDAFRSKTWSGREADDGMAYCCELAAMEYACTSIEHTKAALSAKDKDMRMLPGIHVNWDTFELTQVNPDDYDVLDSGGKQYGLKWFWLQMLHGDGVDHIPGLPKYANDKGKFAQCGEKTAQALLAGIDNNEDAGLMVSSLYAGYYGDEWRVKMLEQALLLWLRRDRDASLHDVRQVLPQGGVGFGPAFTYFDNKIKAAYAQVESLRGGGAQAC